MNLLQQVCNTKGIWIALGIAASVPLFVVAQEGNPFGAIKPAAPAKAEPTPAPASIEEKNPIVLSVRESNPKTPSQLLKAARTVSDIERWDEAKKYLQQLKDLNVSSAEALAIVEEFGSEVFLELQRNPNLNPIGLELGQSILAGAEAESNKPERLAQLISELSSDDIKVRTHGLVALKKLGERALPALFSVLNDASRSSEHTAIEDALVALGDISVDPSLAALDSSVESVRVAAIHLLDRRRATKATTYLLAPYHLGTEKEKEAAKYALEELVTSVPSTGESVHLLSKQLEQFENGALPGKLDHENKILAWRWDAAAGTVVFGRVSATQAIADTKLKLARTLVRIDGSNEVNGIRYAAAALQVAKLAQGWNTISNGESIKSLVGDADLVLESAKLEKVLEHSLKQNQIPAAVAAIELLAQDASVKTENQPNGQAPQLVDCLRHSNRRIQYSAAKALVALNTEKKYPYSNRVIETLSYFANSRGESQVMIGHPHGQQAHDLGAIVEQSGYVANYVRGGRELFLKVRTQPDCEVILVSDVIDKPQASELVQELRKDPRTASIPIVLLAAAGSLEAAQAIVRDIEDAHAFPFTTRAESVQFEVDELGKRTGEFEIGPTERLKIAKESLATLQTLVDNKSVYGMDDWIAHTDVYVNALVHPELQESAADLLSKIGSPAAQRALAQFAVDQATSLDERTRAAAALKKAIAARGMLLTTKEEQLVISSLGLSGEVAPSVEAIAALGTPNAQKALLDLASEELADLPVRQVALEKLKTFVESHGVMLTAKQINLQYDRYNKSRGTAPENTQILGEILDLLEGKAGSQ